MFHKFPSHYFMTCSTIYPAFRNISLQVSQVSIYICYSYHVSSHTQRFDIIFYIFHRFSLIVLCPSSLAHCLSLFITVYHCCLTSLNRVTWFKSSMTSSILIIVTLGMGEFVSNTYIVVTDKLNKDTDIIAVQFVKTK